MAEKPVLCARAGAVRIPAGKARGIATDSVASPPPFGEGLGVGVDVGGHVPGDNNDPLPQPSPNARRACPTCARKDATRASPGRAGEGVDRVCRTAEGKLPELGLLMPRSSRADRSGRRARRSRG